MAIGFYIVTEEKDVLLNLSPLSDKKISEIAFEFRAVAVKYKNVLYGLIPQHTDDKLSCLRKLERIITFFEAKFGAADYKIVVENLFYFYCQLVQHELKDFHTERVTISEEISCNPDPHVNGIIQNNSENDCWADVNGEKITVKAYQSINYKISEFKAPIAIECKRLTDSLDISVCSELGLVIWDFEMILDCECSQTEYSPKNLNTVVEKKKKSVKWKIGKLNGRYTFKLKTNTEIIAAKVYYSVKNFSYAKIETEDKRFVCSNYRFLIYP